jgi:hypothetical protein
MLADKEQISAEGRLANRPDKMQKAARWGGLSWDNIA